MCGEDGAEVRARSSGARLGPTFLLTVPATKKTAGSYPRLRACTLPVAGVVSEHSEGWLVVFGSRTSSSPRGRCAAFGFRHDC